MSLHGADVDVRSSAGTLGVPLTRTPHFTLYLVIPPRRTTMAFESSRFTYGPNPDYAKRPPGSTLRFFLGLEGPTPIDLFGT